jgi:cephalosporin hydroxylase
VNLEAAYKQACATPSDINEHLPVFFDLCVDLRASKVIELGTRGGVSTVAWLYAMELLDGHVWSVDVDPAPALSHARWTFVQGSDLNPEVFKALPDSADIVFIDTSHSYSQTSAELHLYATKVRSGGRIVLHDTELRRPFGVGVQPAYPVKKAVTEYCAEEGVAVTFLPNNFGLAIVSVP